MLVTGSNESIEGQIPFESGLLHYKDLVNLHILPKTRTSGCLNVVGHPDFAKKSCPGNLFNNQYTIAEEILALIYPISLGLGRIETSYLLRHNGVFQYLTGLPTYPNPMTLRRFLLRMALLALPKLRKFRDWLLLSMILKPKPPSK